MDKVRKPFQGVLNIIRFNWHFYLIAFGALIILFFAAAFLPQPLPQLVNAVCILVSATISISLLASYYVYDLSGLYNLNWIDRNNEETYIVNINAGFDETSELLKKKFGKTELVVLDFYDPAKHTEISIKRARRACPPHVGTIKTGTTDLPLKDGSADKIFVTLAAHEIRNNNERVLFFKELSRIIKPGGEIYVTEHLRDFANFVVYNIGFFHFYSGSKWRTTFSAADLIIKSEQELTPFISSFILTKNGVTI